MYSKLADRNLQNVHIVAKFLNFARFQNKIYYCNQHNRLIPKNIFFELFSVYSPLKKSAFGLN